jgi:enoyl-CoA hydratase/carnithine racemase
MTAASRIGLALEERAERRIARVTVENPAKLNTLNRANMAEFAEHFRRLSADENLAAVVLTGAGDKAFIGGADIREMAALDPTSARAFITAVHRTCAVLRDCPVPVIARLNGYTLGAGLEVAASCDLRVASSNAVFGMPEVRVGIPSVVEAALLPGLIGWGRTRELLLFGETIDAQTALAWGLVEQVVAPADLDAAIEARLDALLANGPRAVRLQKALIRQWEDLTLSEAVSAGIDSFAQAYGTGEPAAMMAKFTGRKR